MSLFAPAALALTLLALPIVALHVLKMRRPARVVPSVFLWDAVLHDLQANAPWQRLRRSLALVLQLAAVALLALALAGPYTLRAAALQGDVVVVLDGSLLMTATDIAPSRFAVAKARADALIDNLGTGDVMSIILMTRRPRILIARSADHAALHAALNAAQATDEAADPQAALAVAAALARGSRHASIVVYAAAGGARVVAPAGMAGRTSVVTLGAHLRDLAVVGLSAAPASDGTITALARVSNLGRLPESATLQIDAATGVPGRLTWHSQVDLRPVALAPGRSVTIVRTQLPATVVAVRVHLIGGDDLAADDWAWAAVPSPTARHVVLVTSSPSGSGLFLRLALALDPHVSLDVLAPARYAPDRARSADLVVFDGWLPRRLPAAPLLVVNPAPASGPALGIGVGRAVSGGSIVAAGDPYGLICSACISGVSVGRITPLSVPSWANPILTARGLTAMVAGQRDGRPLAVLGFSLLDTDWALRPGFPVVVQALLEWLVPSLDAPSGIYRPGDAVTFSAPSRATALKVVDPAGHSTMLAPPFPPRPFVATAQPGLYTVQQRLGSVARTALLAVSPFPQPPSAAPAARSAAIGGAARAGRGTVAVDLAPLIAALALLALSGEWWIAVRRR